MIKNEKLIAARNSGIMQPEELFELLQSGAPNIKLVDASYPPNMALPAIGNAVTFDIDDIADPEAPLPHTLPSPEIFASKIQELGITKNDFVVCYDQSGFIMAASRAWWMFRVFGHENVAVLDGGLISWLQKNLPVTEKKIPEPASVGFSAEYHPELVVGFDAIKVASETGSHLILDARPPERFAPANIPGSQNLPALSMMGQNHHLLPFYFESEIDAPIIATCGSGVTACAIALALFKEGRKDVAVYDGSWTEWNTKAGK